ncbi:MAG: flagellum-specific ATP synthase FliI, partial [Hyphomonas sp.]|nr:flagellum-specific ATP synthase FliI [Hyphomonas sp.]
KEYRRMIALHDEVAPMLRANLYEFGKDLDSDRAIGLFPVLDNFVATRCSDGIEASFNAMREMLGTNQPAPAKL